MKRNLLGVIALVTACSCIVSAQDDSELRMKKALEGRMVLVKIDLPAINSGIDLNVDKKDASYNEERCNKLLKEYGVAVKKGNKAKITALRISNRGIELDLDGGGLPGPEWVVGGLKLEEPAPTAKSDREVELERQSQADPSPGMATYLHGEIEYERQRRISQDERNRDAFKRVERLRNEYITQNRKNWGSKVIIAVRQTKEAITLRDIVKSLAKYMEFLPSDKPAS